MNNGTPVKIRCVTIEIIKFHNDSINNNSAQFSTPF